MDKKLSGETLLVVEGKEKVKAVTGELNKDGSPKTVPATEKNNPDFLKIDKHGNVLENFFSNFMRQSKNPTEFLFFKVPIDGVEALATVISDILKEGYESGKALLDEYRVNPKDYVSKEQKQTSDTEKNEKPNLIADEQVDWDALSNLGLSKASLEKKNCLKSLLNYGKTPLLPVKMDLQGVNVETQARLSLRKGADDKLSFVVHGIRKQPELDKPFYGHSFTDQEKKALLETGNLGKLIDLQKTDGTTLPIYVSIDKLTNDIVGLRADKIKVPDEIKGVVLSEKQKKEIKEGKAVFVEGMTSKKGTDFSAHLQINAEKRGVEFLFNNQQNQSQGVRIPERLGGVELSKEQQENLKAEKAIYVEGLTDKSGQTYSAYIKVNTEKGKLDFFKWNPDKAQEKKPDNTHETQVEVNSNGKTNEATKKEKEPLKKGQTQASAKPKTTKTKRTTGVKM